MKLLGVCNHSPDFILSRLRKRLELKYSHIFICHSELPDATEKVKLLLVPSPGLLKRHMVELNTKRFKDTIIVVFGNPIDLSDFNVQQFDYRLADDIHLDGFQLTPFNLAALDVEVPAIVFEKRDFLADVLEKVQSFTGILTQLMTFIYTMPSSTHQTPIKKLACYWLASENVNADLDTRLAKIKNTTPLTDKQIKRLKDILFSDKAAIYRKALQATKHLAISELNTDEFIRIVSSFQVSAYEIRYIRAITKEPEL